MTPADQGEPGDSRADHGSFHEVVAAAHRGRMAATCDYRHQLESVIAYFDTVVPVPVAAVACRSGSTPSLPSRKTATGWPRRDPTTAGTG
jgi:3-oxoacyl-ACP reductase-like protein